MKQFSSTIKKNLHWTFKSDFLDNLKSQKFYLLLFAIFEFYSFTDVKVKKKINLKVKVNVKS